MNKPCDVKIMYDTEFEAEIAASKIGYKYGAEMTHYPCGRHWHIANVKVELRSKNDPNSRRYCHYCDTYMRKRKWSRHLSLLSHQNKVRQAKRDKEDKDKGGDI